MVRYQSIWWLAFLILARNAQATNEMMQLEQIMEKVAEGNYRIAGEEDDAILLLGNTGSGKSTLAYLLMGKKLQGIFNDATGDTVVDAVEPIESLKISHNKSSETKIPNKCNNTEMINKCLAKNVVIWDCPGFNDTNIVQEIANSFYIKKLYNQHKRIKFVLVVSHGSLADKGTSFISILQQFCNSFKNIEAIKNSVALVITGVPARKNIDHLRNTLTSIASENESLTADARTMIGYLVDKIILFQMPKEEGLLPEEDLLSKINHLTEYIPAKADLGRFSLSQKAFFYCQKLLDMSSSNLTLLMSILSEAIASPGSCTQDTGGNPFMSRYALIKKWLPANIAYKESSEDRIHYVRDRFVIIKQLKALLKKAEEIDKVELLNLYDTTEIMRDLFDVFEEYVLLQSKDDIQKTRDLKQKIQHFSYATKQMKEYFDLFNSLIATSNLDSDVQLAKKLHDKLQASRTDLQKTLKDAVHTLDIDENVKDVDYYIEAINILQLEPGHAGCIKKQAICNRFIGGVKKRQGDLGGALNYFTNSLRLESNHNTCNEIGDILQAQGKFYDAVKFYKVVENTIQLKKCFKNLKKTEEHNAALYEKFGDIWMSFSMYGPALECYMDAKSLSKDEHELNERSATVASCLRKFVDTKEIEGAANRIKQADYFDYDSLGLLPCDKAQ